MFLSGFLNSVWVPATEWSRCEPEGHERQRPAAPRHLSGTHWVRDACRAAWRQNCTFCSMPKSSSSLTAVKTKSRISPVKLFPAYFILVYIWIINSYHLNNEKWHESHFHLYNSAECPRSVQIYCKPLIHSFILTPNCGVISIQFPILQEKNVYITGYSF